MPCFAARVRRGEVQPCDVILVDGDHSSAGFLADVLNAAHLAPCEPHALLMDVAGNEVRGAIRQATRAGVVTVDRGQSSVRVGLLAPEGR